VRKYFSFPDRAIINILPQVLQHELIQKNAEGLGGVVVGYTTENSLSIKSHANLRKKMKNLNGVDGFIFFRCNQFFDDTHFNYELIKELIELNYEVHFVVEKWSICSEVELFKYLPYLISGAYLSNSSKNIEYIKAISQHV